MPHSFRSLLVLFSLQYSKNNKQQTFIANNTWQKWKRVNTLLLSLNQHICFTICFAVTIFKENTSEVRLLGILNNTLVWQHLRMGRKCQASYYYPSLLHRNSPSPYSRPRLALWSFADYKAWEWTFWYKWP